jgi:hypothetical protein
LLMTKINSRIQIVPQKMTAVVGLATTNGEGENVG